MPLHPKPKLKARQVTYLEVDYNDLERFIKQIYDREYEIPCGEGMDSGDSVNFRIIKKPLDQYDKDGLTRWLRGRDSEELILRIILTDLCNNDFIDPGSYLISVSW